VSAILRVVRGEPSAEELAALVAVLAAARQPAEHPVPPAGSQWGAPGRAVREPVAATGWWASALPR